MATATIDLAMPAAPTAAAGDLVLLGHIVSWRVRGTALGREELRGRLAAAGLERYLPPRPPSAKTALRRAIADWARERAGEAPEGADGADGDDGEDETDGRKRLIRAVRGPSRKDRASWIIYALVEESSVVQKMGLRYATSYRFFYAPQPGAAEGTLRVSTAGLGELAEDERSQVEDELRPYWERHRQLYVAADLSRVIAAIVLDLDAAPLRDEGGSYFVPIEHAARLERLERLVQALPQPGRGAPPPRFYALEQVDLPKSRERLREAAYDALAREVREAEGNLQRFVEQDARKPGSVRARTVEALLADFLALRRKAALFAEGVGMRAERFAADLEGLEQQARALVPQGGRAGRVEAGPQGPGQLALDLAGLAFTREERAG